MSCFTNLRKIIKLVCAQSDKINPQESENVFQNFRNQKQSNFDTKNNNYCNSG